MNGKYVGTDAEYACVSQSDRQMCCRLCFGMGRCLSNVLDSRMGSEIVGDHMSLTVTVVLENVGEGEGIVEANTQFNYI